MTKKALIPLSFIGLSTLALSLSFYAITAKGSLHPKLFITTCGEILNNIKEHIHFNSEGVMLFIIMSGLLIGIGLSAIYTFRFLVSSKRLRKQLKIVEDIPRKLSWVIRKHQLETRKFIVIKEKKLTAYTIGILNPRIIISDSLINKTTKQQLEAIVLHETFHIQKHHLLSSLLARLTSLLFFFIPLINYLYRQLRILFETTADSFVVRQQKTRVHLSDSLALNLSYASEFTQGFASTSIEKRVDSLVSNNIVLEKIKSWQMATSLVSIVFLFALVLLPPVQVGASSNFQDNATCQIENNCQTAGCADHQLLKQVNFTPLIPPINTKFIFTLTDPK